MAIVDLIAQSLLELPAAGVAWLLQRTTGMNKQTAELIGNFSVLGVIAGACLVAWFVYQST